MRRQPSLRSRVAGRVPTAILADPIKKSKAISLTLPSLIEDAEAAGLSIVAQHLYKALILARRVAASGETSSLPS